MSTCPSITLAEAAKDYIAHLKTLGKKDRTLYTYNKDLEQAIAFFGAERKLECILTPHVGKFLKSDALLKLPDGGLRAKVSTDKTTRVFRMLLIWAQTEKYIKALPFPKDMPVGRGGAKLAISKEEDAVSEPASTPTPASSEAPAPTTSDENEKLPECW